MRKIIVFFNDGAPYLVKVGEHLASLRLEYPDETRVDLPIRKALIAAHDECAFVSDRDVSMEEIREALGALVE